MRGRRAGGLGRRVDGVLLSGAVLALSRSAADYARGCVHVQVMRSVNRVYAGVSVSRLWRARFWRGEGVIGVTGFRGAVIGPRSFLRWQSGPMGKPECAAVALKCLSRREITELGSNVMCVRGARDAMTQQGGSMGTGASDRCVHAARFGIRPENLSRVSMRVGKEDEMSIRFRHCSSGFVDGVPVPSLGCFEGRLLRTADLAWSMSGRVRLCFGEGFLLRFCLPRFMNGRPPGTGKLSTWPSLRGR